ncbi:hypothetical protein RP20_CCG016899 [Aedes albopictus]|nr:hypothetical protein RP20_CCG016899 [Aedes albopictus]
MWLRLPFTPITTVLTGFVGRPSFDASSARMVLTCEAQSKRMRHRCVPPELSITWTTAVIRNTCDSDDFWLHVHDVTVEPLARSSESVVDAASGFSSSFIDSSGRDSTSWLDELDDSEFSKCSNVLWRFLHWAQDLSEPHSLALCPFRRQLKHSLDVFTFSVLWLVFSLRNSGQLKLMWSPPQKSHSSGDFSDEVAA